MRRALLLATAALAVAAGTARADTFALVNGAPAAPAPNAADRLPLPPEVWRRPQRTSRLPYATLQGIWRRAGGAFGIPWQLLGAINKVESNFGLNMGPSSAGAVGWMQFMPSTWLRWGTDADGDGVADPWDPEDAIYSAARYLAAAGGTTDVARAVFAYNHAQWYVDEVLSLARVFGMSDGVAVSFDPFAASLAPLQQTVDRTSAALGAAERAEHRMNRLHAAQAARAARADLLSTRLVWEKRAALTAARADGARADARRLRRALRAAEARLGAAQRTAPSFSPSALASVASDGLPVRHAFPVGGGSALVSVSHTHHDYPAADLAAPEGTGVYALADGVVVAAWPQPSGRCGIGFTFRAADGLTWTYCHLSYLDPVVSYGAALVAGASVGRVGSTGHASGPHLHLQVQPATLWPQQQPWFESYAGTAFRWQDGGAGIAVSRAAADGPRFAVVRAAQWVVEEDGS